MIDRLALEGELSGMTTQRIQNHLQEAIDFILAAERLTDGEAAIAARYCSRAYRAIEDALSAVRQASASPD